MITVNLVPKEIIRKERTPIGQFAAILVAVLLVVGSFAAFLYMEYGRLAEVESELSKVNAELELVRPHKEYADKLEAEKREFRRRTETIQGIGKARVLWSKKLDEFWEVIHNKGDAESHNVWVNSLAATSPPKGSKAKRKSSGVFKISGLSASDQSKKLSNFHRDLMQSEFFKSFFHINDPAGSVVYFDDGKEPNAAWRFNFTMKMASKAPEKPKRKKKKKKKKKK